jgi:hypothetical protein
VGQRSIVDQVVGRCKTEASQKRIPLDEYTAQDLLAWYQSSTGVADPRGDETGVLRLIFVLFTLHFCFLLGNAISGSG